MEVSVSKVLLGIYIYMVVASYTYIKIAGRVTERVDKLQRVPSHGHIIVQLHPRGTINEGRGEVEASDSLFLYNALYHTHIYTHTYIYMHLLIRANTYAI